MKYERWMSKEGLSDTRYGIRLTSAGKSASPRWTLNGYIRYLNKCGTLVHGSRSPRARIRSRLASRSKSELLPPIQSYIAFSSHLLSYPSNIDKNTNNLAGLHSLPYTLFRTELSRSKNLHLRHRRKPILRFIRPYLSFSFLSFI